ncbi:hypothetical protein [Shewanella sp. Isolate11]|uniref:hypothetical protein n=1 Tax=Shewanella sp. Isolate11 TaxID=2908530 RepID=UPI001EFE2CD0|nr:hypothetical protein [Shewanella sp. Isolate11]MCG9698205.1 hypothetical protein [Shewanella sp. Isolate11]
MEHKMNQGQIPQDVESDSYRKQRSQYLEKMLDGNETDLKDEEPDCYILGYN